MMEKSSTMILKSHLCECGCGQMIELKEYHRYYGVSRFVFGHHRRGITKEINPNLAHSEETKEKIRVIHTGMKFSEKHCRSMSVALTERKFSENHCRNISKVHTGMKHSKETKRKISAALTRKWCDSEFAKMQMGAQNVKPNKVEIQVDCLLSEMFVDNYKYVGDGKFWIEGRNPDFININGQKKIIELFGEYWHGEEFREGQGDTLSNEEHERERIEHFAEYGYQTLIIWEHELEDLVLLRKKLIEFNANL